MVTRDIVRGGKRSSIFVTRQIGWLHQPRSFVRGLVARMSAQLDWRAVDLQPKDHVGFLPSVDAVLIVRLAVKLVGGKVEISVGGNGQRVRPQDSRVVHQSLVAAIGPSSDDSVDFVSGRVETPLFRVAVTNSLGNATSSSAMLTVTPPPPVAPSISGPPTDQSVIVGQTATFTVIASGTPPLTFQWQINGTDIPGAINQSYTTPATVLADDGALYRVVVANTAGNATSSAATLTVTPAPVVPLISDHPDNQSVIEGQTATFTVLASGTAPLAYQWLRNNINIPGATSSSYTTPGTILADDGSQYRVVVSNTAGNATSNTATLIVQVPTPAGSRGAGKSRCGLLGLEALIALWLLGRSRRGCTRS